MNRPIVLHVRSSPDDYVFLNTQDVLVSTLAHAETGAVKCYDAIDMPAFISLIQRAENASSLQMLPVMSGQAVIAEFSDGRMKVYENITRYLEIYCLKTEESPMAAVAVTSEAPPRPPTEEEIEQYMNSHEEGSKKIVQNYISHINMCIFSTNLVSIYNRVQKIPHGEQIPDVLRREAHNHARLTFYKCSIVPLRNAEDMGKIVSMMAIFDEAEIDDTRTILTQTVAPSSMILTLSRVQRRSRDREFTLHCLAILASLKFEEGSSRGRSSSMYQ